MSNALFVALIGENGIEMPISRMYCEFSGPMLNPSGVGMSRWNTSTLTYNGGFGVAASLGLSRQSFGPMLMTFPLDAPVALGGGNTLTIVPGGISIDPMIAQVIWSNPDIVSPTYNDWMADKRNVPLLPQEIWDAGFLAGSQFTRILLTGEPNG